MEHWKAMRPVNSVTLLGYFVADTQVHMADGSTKPIQLIKEGDLVLSKDEKTGAISSKKVLSTSTRSIPTVMSVNLEDEKGNIEHLTLTADHPFYVVDKGFVPAYQMPVGSKVQGQNGILTVKSTERHEDANGYKVYNFTVEDDHSYFVGNVDGGIWVHNGKINCQQEARAIRSLYNNIIHNAKLTPLGEVSGAIKELKGIPTGWDHVTELNNAMKGIEKSIKILQRSDSPAAQQAIKDGLEHLDKVWDALGKGLYP